MAAEVPMTTADSQDTVEQKIRDAVATGELVDLHGPGPVDLLQAHMAAHDASREVHAGLLIELLTAEHPAGARPRRAIRLCGATIVGRLNLEAASLACPLLLEHCWFTEPAVFDDVTALKISLRGCHVPGLSARKLRTTGNLALDDGFTSTAGVSLAGARIGGQLLFNDAHLARPKRLESAAALGIVSALAADGLTVDGDLFARDQFTADGEVRLPNANIGGQLDLSGATVTNRRRIALFADNLTVGQHMILRKINASGRIEMRGASIGGELILERARLSSPGSSALIADHLTVGQDMSCSDGFRADGEISLSAARIGGHLFLIGAHLRNPGDRALDADWLTVERSLICRDDFTADGQVAVAAARIGGQVAFIDCHLNNPDGVALLADRIDIGQTLTCLKGFTARGEVRLRGARIGSHADLLKTHLINPGGTALNAMSITAGAFHCGDGFTADGQVNLQGAKINGPLDFDGATLSRPGGTALDLSNANTTALGLCPAHHPAGAVDLTNTHVGAFTDDQATWPSTLHLRGFTYETLENSTMTVRDRLRWLKRHPGGYTPQVYDQLAACYRRAGHEEAARRVAIVRQRRRRHMLSPLNWLLWITVGYGYRTWVAAIWLAVLAIAGTPVFSRAYSHHLFRPAANAPAFHPLIYTLDTLLPIINCGQKNAWTPTGWALRCSWLLTAAGWVLTTAAVAALTGIFKRD
jgi:hypothetical protein